MSGATQLSGAIPRFNTCLIVHATFARNVHCDIIFPGKRRASGDSPIAARCTVSKKRADASYEGGFLSG
jgi:hypothetical protein